MCEHFWKCFFWRIFSKYNFCGTFKKDGETSWKPNNRLYVRRINNEGTKMNETNAERSFEEANNHSNEFAETILRNEMISLRAKAAEYVRLKRWSDAEKMYAKAIEICPDVYVTEKQDLYNQHIDCSMNLSLWEEAINGCAKLLQFNASNETVQKRCAICYVNLMKSAIESFENYRINALNNPIQFFTKEFHNIKDIPNESHQYEVKRFGLKDCIVSEELRKLGNEYYVSGNFTKALRVYFEAFDTALQTDVTYFLAMKNIATVLMKIGFPKEALKHFDRLKRSAEKNPSDKLSAVLFSNKIKECQRLSQTKFYKTPEEKLYKGANKTCAQLSSAVCVQYDETRERHLVAAENIPEGMVVIKEIPVIMVASNNVTRCKYCCRLLPLSYLPCEDCNARFCDEKCLEEGALMHSLDHCYGGENGLKSIGMCELIAKAIDEYSYDEMKRSIEEVPNRKDVHSLRPLDGKSFEAVMLLKAYPFDDYDNNIVIDQFVDNICQIMKSKFSDVTSVECRRFISDVTHELMKRIPINANAIHQNPKEVLMSQESSSFMLQASSSTPFSVKTYYSEVVQLLSRCPNDLYETLLSVALLPIASIVNHSCAPNLYHSCSGTDECCFIVRTVREIRAGEELLCSYGPLAGCHTYEQRKKLLLEQYDFICECEVCRHGGDHHLDKVIIGRYCLRCKRRLITTPYNDDVLLLCDECVHGSTDIKSDLDSDIEKFIGTYNWQKYDGNLLMTTFDRALNVYPYGNQTFTDFTLMLVLISFKNGDMDSTYKYMKHLIDMRNVIFGSRVHNLIASSYFAFVVLLYIRICSTKNLCGVKYLEEMKKHAFEARQLFRILYGEGNLRDLEIDFMLSAARRAISEK